LSEVWTAVDTFYQTAPYAAGALTCGVKASAADFVAQRREWNKNNAESSSMIRSKKKEKKSFLKKFETARNVAFLVYGAMYQGLAQEFIYNHCYVTWFGDSNQIWVVLKKVFFDIFVQTTLVTLPVAYLTKSVIFGYPLREGLRRYKDDILNQGLLKKYFLLWGPVQCLTFGVVPEHLRISFIAGVSFFWLIILSTISARGDASGGGTTVADEVATAATPAAVPIQELSATVVPLENDTQEEEVVVVN
jgi:protein Mpv17